MRLTAAAPRSSEYSPIATAAPSAANTAAIASPFPDPAPVTIATRPSSRPTPRQSIRRNALASIRGATRRRSLATLRHVQFGAVLSQSELGPELPTLRDYVQAVQDLGFDFLVTADHVVGAD